jgi:uncharacterized protein YvpB
MPVKTLDVPYLSQLDNQNNPTGSCNVTSISMTLLFFGIHGDRSYPQLEDQLYRRCEDNGWSRHCPYDLQKLAQSYPGVRDDFTENGTLNDIRQSIDAGMPCVLHGYFTRFGHIIVVKGYDDSGFIVNDPYGEWCSWGYDCGVSGESLHYSSALIANVCSPESAALPSNIWLHRISRPKTK